MMAHLVKRDVYVQDLFAGADPHYQMPVQIISEYAWQALFVHQFFLRPTPEDLATHVPEFTVIAAPEFEAIRSAMEPVLRRRFCWILRGKLF